MSRTNKCLQIMIGGLVILNLLVGGCSFFHWNEKSMQTQSIAATGDEVKKIAITFDDGPNPKYTPMLLKGLEERNVKATFFITGENAKQYKEVVEAIQAGGHLIGNHTYHHTNLENADEEMIQKEVVSANEIIYEITGEYPQFIRPPFGACQKGIEEQTGMLCVLWTVEPLDWCTMDAGVVAKRIVTNAKENGIILLHDQYETSVTGALLAIDELQNQGYEFVTVDEIMLD